MMLELFGKAANSNRAVTKTGLTAFEEKLFAKFTEFHSKGFVAFLVVLIPDKNGNCLMTYTDPKTNNKIPCSYDFTPIPEGANPHNSLVNYNKANLPVVMAIDLITKGSDPRKQMPAGWKPGSIAFPSVLQDKPVLSLASPETYTSRVKEEDAGIEPPAKHQRPELRLVVREGQRLEL